MKPDLDICHNLSLGYGGDTIMRRAASLIDQMYEALEDGSRDMAESERNVWKVSVASLLRDVSQSEWNPA
jgi:hypothetical protein